MIDMWRGEIALVAKPLNVDGTKSSVPISRFFPELD
jgi:hypothetical protein